MSILCIDYGKVRTGLAYSPDGKIVVALPTINLTKIKSATKRLDVCIDKIHQIIQEKNPEKIILGIPYLKNNNVSNFTREVLEFKKRLEEKLKTQIYTIDESHSTQEAREMIPPSTFSSHKKKKYINGASAIILLQRFISKC